MARTQHKATCPLRHPEGAVTYPFAGLDLSGLPPETQAFLKACPIAEVISGESQAEPLNFTGMEHRRHGHVLQIGFDLGRQFLATWWAWQHAPVRSERLFFSVVTDQALPDLGALKSLAIPASLEALQGEWLEAWHGMTPGSHRLVLAGGQVQLSLHCGQTDPLLRELALTAPADTVLLDAAFWATADTDTSTDTSPGRPPASALQRLRALSRLCRLGTHVFLSQGIQQGHEAAEIPGAQAWAQCGFELTPASDHSPSTTTGWTRATYAPAWAARGDKPEYANRRNGSKAPRPSRTMTRPMTQPITRNVLVLGAGLSGSAVAHSLASRGWSVQVIDQGDGVGAGASGLPVGLAAPHVSPDDNVLSRITRAGVRATLQLARQCLVSGSDWAPTGVIEHRVEGKRSLPAAHLWPPSAHEWSTQATAQQLSESGLPPNAQALWHGLAGWVRPRQLVAAQLQTPGVQVLWGQQIQSIKRVGDVWTACDAQGQTLAQAPLLVVASAFDSLALLQPLAGVDLPLNPLRGQISFGLMDELNPGQRQQLAPYPVNGHGSFISGVPTPEGPPGWFIGSTFERQCLQAPLRPEDHAANQLRLAKLLPPLGEAMKPLFEPHTVQGWAGLRCTLPDRLPAVGPVDSEHWPGLWMSAGMGARGISLAVLCGELTAAWLEDEPLPLAPDLARHLAAERFKRD